MYKRVLAVFAVAAGLIIGAASVANADSVVAIEDQPVRVDTVYVDTSITNKGPIRLISSTGISFISSPEDLFESPGLYKTAMLVYPVSESFDIGVTVAGQDFDASSVTQADIEQYGAVGIYHEPIGLWGLRMNVMFQMIGQNIGSGPVQLSSVVGGFIEKPLSATSRFSAIVGGSTVPVDFETKAWSSSVWIGLGTSLTN